MDEERTLRARMLLGDEAAEKLKNSHVAVFGLGGVGSWCGAGSRAWRSGHFVTGRVAHA